MERGPLENAQLREILALKLNHRGSDRAQSQYSFYCSLTVKSKNKTWPSEIIEPFLQTNFLNEDVPEKRDLRHYASTRWQVKSGAAACAGPCAYETSVKRLRPGN